LIHPELLCSVTDLSNGLRSSHAAGGLRGANFTIFRRVTSQRSGTMHFVLRSRRNVASLRWNGGAARAGRVPFASERHRPRTSIPCKLLTNLRIITIIFHRCLPTITVYITVAVQLSSSHSTTRNRFDLYRHIADR